MPVLHWKFARARSFAGESIANYKTISPGLIVYTKSPLREAPYGIVKASRSTSGIVSPLYGVYSTNDGISPCFIEAYFANALRRNRYFKPLVNLGPKHTMCISDDGALGGTIVIPTKEEQDKICGLLDVLDSRIAAQRRFVELLKKHKRGVMEQIFGRRLNMGENSEKWDIVELRDLFTKVARRNREGKIKNVITNSAEFGLIPQRDFFDKSIAVDGNTDGYYVIRTGDFVYNPRKSTTAPFGPFNRYTGIEDGIISPLYTCLVPKGKANPEYLAWYFRSTAWHRYVYDNGSQGARHDRVNMTDDLLSAFRYSCRQLLFKSESLTVSTPSMLVGILLTKCWSNLNV
jgi:type I restriction enzyme, S subunit